MKQILEGDHFSFPLCAATATLIVTATETSAECHAAATTTIKPCTFCLFSCALKTLTLAKTLSTIFATQQSPLLHHLLQP